MYNDIYSSLQYLTKHFHILKIPLCSAYIFLFSLLIPGTNLFTVSTVSPFPECHLGVIVEFRACSWLLPLINLHLNFLHVFSWLDYSFFKHWIVFYGLDFPQFIYIFTYWRTSWLLPRFGNHWKAAINTHV